MIKRRRFLNVATSSLGGFSMAYLLGSCSQQNQQNVASNISSLEIKAKVLRMGYQSAGDLVRNRQVLEKRLDPLGIKVEWLQFAQGPQLMEGMAARRVDVGSVGETPPIFAADRKFAQENPGLLKIVIEELHALDKWAELNRDEVKKLMITEQKLDEDVAARVMSRRTFAGRRGLSPALIAEQQRVADLFFQEGVIPKKINIQEALLPPDLYAAITPREIMV